MCIFMYICLHFYNTQISVYTCYSYLNSIPNHILHKAHCFQQLNNLESIKLGLAHTFFPPNCTHHSTTHKNHLSYHESCKLGLTVGMFYHFDCSNIHLSIECSNQFPFWHKKGQSLGYLLFKEHKCYQKLCSLASSLSILRYSYPKTCTEGFVSYTSHLLR